MGYSTSNSIYRSKIIAAKIEEIFLFPTLAIDPRSILKTPRKQEIHISHQELTIISVY